MAETGRNPDGTFRAGNNLGKGRPPRDYSISHAINLAKKQTITTDDDGEPLTAERAAAEWLVECAARGVDRRNTSEGPKEHPLPFRDRLEALRTVLKCVEPDFKITDANLDDDLDETGLTVDEAAYMQQVTKMSADERRVLEVALGKMLSSGHDGEEHAN